MKDFKNIPPEKNKSTDRFYSFKKKKVFVGKKFTKGYDFLAQKK